MQEKRHKISIEKKVDAVSTAVEQTKQRVNDAMEAVDIIKKAASPAKD